MSRRTTDIMMTTATILSVILIALIAPEVSAYDTAGTITAVVAFTPSGAGINATLVSFSYSSTTVKSFFPTMGTGDYAVTFFNDNNETIVITPFSVSTTVLGTDSAGTEHVITAKSTPLSFRLELPVYATKLAFSRNTDVLLEVNLSKKLCNTDARCEYGAGENIVRCPAECGTIATNMTPPAVPNKTLQNTSKNATPSILPDVVQNNTTKDHTPPKTANATWLVWTAITLIVLTILAFFIIGQRRRPTPTTPSIGELGDPPENTPDAGK